MGDYLSIRRDYVYYSGVDVSTNVTGVSWDRGAETQSLSNQWDTIRIISDGDNWLKI